MVNRVGLLTIGQSPRTDLEADFQRNLGGLEVWQFGALDDLSPRKIQGLVAGSKGQILTTRLRDGQEVSLSKEKLLPLIQTSIDKAEKAGIMLKVILCTSYFPPFDTKGILLEPGKIMLNLVQTISPGAKLGVIVPSEGQQEQSKAKWRKAGKEVHTHVMSAYSKSDDLWKTSLKQDFAPYDALILDCLGYHSDFKNRLREFFGGVILLPLEITLKLCAALAG